MLYLTGKALASQKGRETLKRRRRFLFCPARTSLLLTTRIAIDLAGDEFNDFASGNAIFHDGRDLRHLISASAP
jgi:hypothetical protein